MYAERVALALARLIKGRGSQAGSTHMDSYGLVERGKKVANYVLAHKYKQSPVYVNDVEVPCTVYIPPKNISEQLDPRKYVKLR
jgi:hypothetical protein